MLQPYIARGRVAEWYRGTADAVLQNLNVIEQAPGDTVLVLAGDHIYKMDYQPFVAAHRRHRADVTIAVRRVPLADATRMGILAIDDTTASSSGTRSRASPSRIWPAWASTSSPSGPCISG
jgi:glucose-1-phosphate adenylyltransferase